ncbi:MAG TPA: LysR family transcriptional regulator [Burkholderiaceae bacterium]|nr:LysR family transcriptional regulator [Burkholderiaceae bacterium]
MDLRQLRYFVAVARESSFTRAAEQLHIAQPPLSRQIQSLEEELGVKLLVRKSRPVRLTDAGRVFYEQALQILAHVEQMQIATRRVGLNQRTVLNIGFVASTLYSGLPHLIRKLREQAPDIEVQLVELTSIQQTEALIEGRIDIGVGRIPHSDPHVIGIVLREERLAVALPPGSDLARSDDPLELQQLRGQRLIVYPREPRPSFADQVLGVFHAYGIRPGEVQEVREIQTALGLVAADFGVCVIPKSARQMRQDLCYRLLEGEHAVSPIILNHRASDESAHIELVKRLVQEMYEDQSIYRD